ncbi:hypothetical protein MAR_022208 [Mya arenaria]|uniref:Uncharacterized protein n=1 Tax=Mya arenaria TaxID=6604 RepID=A0ABY7DSA3_MYAAR|nr:hypothetical protein MAR_022208 [Mya arenaria]
MEALETNNSQLKARINKLESQLDESYHQHDKDEQYSRRNNLRLSGVPESDGESTDQKIIELTSLLGRTFRSMKKAGRTDSESCDHQPAAQQRATLVRNHFTSYRARNKLFNQKTKLKGAGYGGCYLNADLTRTRSDLFFQSRDILRKKSITIAWTADGVIIAKCKNDRKYRIETSKYFAAFKLKANL